MPATDDSRQPSGALVAMGVAKHVFADTDDD